MAHAVSNATVTPKEAPKVEHTQPAQNAQAPKPAAKSSAPEDKVTISEAGRAAQTGGKK